MAKWLQSGRRRDLCFILYDEGPLGAQALKTRLEAHYDERIEPESFYGALDTLVETGHLERGEAGIHDEYALTDAGRDRLEEHVDWVRERTGGPDGATGGPDSGTGDADGATGDAETDEDEDRDGGRGGTSRS